ncbi:MAG: HD domain-containing protein [Cetobacterium sp.]
MIKTKIIKDLVHTYIEVDHITQKIIDTPQFQRLKKIKQLTASTLFPSANHTRFDHSLGVMKLSQDFFDSILPSFEKESEKEGIPANLEYFRKNLKIAALLHDLGHAPFSHLGEQFYNKKEIKNNLRVKCLNNSLNYDEIFGEDPKGSSHELMSCFCILDKMIPYIQEQKIDLEFICRIIIGNKYTNNWQKNIMIEIVNSTTIDVDKLDYLLRDNHMCGYPAPKVDVPRLLKSLYIENKKINFYPNGVPALQSLIDSRDSLYLWVYNHHLAVYTDYITGDLIRHLIEVEKTLNWRIYFSCEAISTSLICDSDLETFLLNEYRKVKRGESSSDYVKSIVPQIFERNFLKPSWKTIYEYVEFKEKELGSDLLVEVIKEKLLGSEDKKYEERAKLVKKMRQDLNLKSGELFLIIRSNKFYHTGGNASFYVTLNGSAKSLSNLLPQKDYKRFDNISFYLFGPDNKKEDIKKSFIKCIEEFQ